MAQWLGMRAALAGNLGSVVRTHIGQLITTCNYRVLDTALRPMYVPMCIRSTHIHIKIP